MARSDDWQRMVRGEPYCSLAPDLLQQRELIRQRSAQFNRAPSKGHLKRLFEQFESVGEQCFIEAGLFVDYGSQMTLGRAVYINAHCVFLDSAPIRIDDEVLIGPAAQFYTAQHALDAEARAKGLMWAEPIHIKTRAWIGGGAIILPGITIGVGAVVAAGSVVTRDVADGALVKGNPAH